MVMYKIDRRGGPKIVYQDRPKVYPKRIKYRTDITFYKERFQLTSGQARPQGDTKYMALYALTKTESNLQLRD